ncbi:hypothetical protein R84981_001413 [Carnimonas sp. R-84981]|uniref:heparin lyase I family protein n=1 Tax=Carnimonas bestiolae TaxID=3402172 RepID=UPI003EDB976A
MNISVLLKVCCVIFFLLPCGVIAQTSNKLIDRDQCSSIMGKGANLVGVQNYQGKCEGNAVPPVLDRNGIITFHIKKGRKGTKDRSELADVKRRLQFNKAYCIKASIKIPKNSDITKSFFYVLQFWQGGGYPPFAGVRINRNSSHQAVLIARSKKNDKGNIVAKMDFSSGNWMDITMRIKVGSDRHGEIIVWNNGYKVADWRGKIGYANSNELKKFYRMKFGIYKGSEPKKDFIVLMKNVSIEKILN